ncbi:hypothetical protein [Nocardia sp. CDC160]|uniref:hypothetical protein n=1 Tax=Nocardia sp. CDC160 TaxID=3112166 RepID=UPI002DB697A0|nr:hypothetical protein [Nocardia sp. CDC160]MEC3920370.1 hypothetical protein [Nocardia sp. CDC160]
MMPSYEEGLAAYLAEAADMVNASGKPAYAVATLQAWCTAIAYHYSIAGLPNPARSVVVSDTLADIRAKRLRAGIEANKAGPLLTPMVAHIVESIDEHAHGWRARIAARRDIALILVQYAAGLRRGELVGLSIADVTRPPDSADRCLRIRVRGRASGDIEVVRLGKGAEPRMCPCCALLRWLAVLAAFDRAISVGAGDPAAAGQLAVQRVLRRNTADELHICERDWPNVRRAGSPLFRPLDRDGLPYGQALTSRSVPNILKRRAAQAGFEPEVVDRMRGSSARAGAMVQAMANGAEAYVVARHMRLSDVSAVVGAGKRESGGRFSASDHLGL